MFSIRKRLRKGARLMVSERWAGAQWADLFARICALCLYHWSIRKSPWVGDSGAMRSSI